MPLVHIRLKGLKPKETDFEPQTLGDHVRKRRLMLRITQKEAPTRIGVTQYTIINWEKRRTKPPTWAVPGLIRFLGYDPYPQPTSIGEHLRACRMRKGWPRKRMAAHLRVDESTLRDWEAGRTILFRKHRIRVANLLGLDQQELADEMQARWKAKHGQREAPALED